MELKKSRKYDLERSRPLRLALSFVSVIAMVVILGSTPMIISTMMNLRDDYGDETVEDLNIDFKEEDDMIQAIQTEVQDEVTEIIKPVETVTEAVEPEDSPELEATKEQIVETDFDPEELLKDEELAPMQEEKDAKPIANPEQEDLLISQQLPEYPGGMTELVKWLNKNIKYPQTAIKNKLQGEVQIAFYIEKDGACTDFKVIKSAHILLDQEALRVCRMMPTWKPGKIKGKVCRTYFVIPVNFEPL